MIAKFIDDRKEAFDWIRNHAESSAKLCFYYTSILWVLEMVSCALKLNFYSSYNSTLQQSSVGQDLALYTTVLFSLDLAVIIIYSCILCSFGKKENGCFTISGLVWVLLFAFRFYYGIYFLYEDSKVETDDTTLENSIKINVIYEICLDVYMLPPAIIGGMILIAAGFR